MTTQENVRKIHRMILGVRKLKVREKAESMNLLIGTVTTIFHEHLGVKKL